MTLSPSDRMAALSRTEVDLLWLTLPYRPTCKPCEGEGRKAATVCGECNGIGTTEPTSRLSPLDIARQHLLDGDLQAAIIRAQRPEGATKPTEGSTAWSDPTGEAAASEAAVMLRANDITTRWLGLLDVIGESIAHVDATARIALSIAPSAPINRTPVTLARIRWLTRIPRPIVNEAAKLLGDEDLGKYDHAIDLAAGLSMSLRSGRPYFNDKAIPSVFTVLDTSRRTLEAAPPKPAQLDRVRCRNCWRFGIDQDCASSSSSFCSRCIEFRKAHACMPTEAICRHWHNGRRGVPPAMVVEAKAQGKAKRKAKAS